ncbi:MAG: hypothetical protein Q4A90_09985 [Streptococcus sp.]|nr:hypothetical protein [Streptococcus sp.]
MQLDKKITCVLYNSNNETVFVFLKNRRGDSLNNHKLNDLLDRFDINLKESDFTEIFSNEDELVLLANIDSDSSTTNFEEWVAIQDLKTILSDNDLVLKSILNYFFRIDKFPKAQLSITLECPDKFILKNCKELIFQLNPGISSENRAGKLGIKITDSNKEGNSEVIHLSLNQQIINRPHVHNLLIEAEDSITEIYKKVMELIANLYSQTVSKNVLYLPANFYGISGMTESGKSYYSKILDLKKHFWNLKNQIFY